VSCLQTRITRAGCKLNLDDKSCMCTEKILVIECPGHLWRVGFAVTDWWVWLEWY